MAIETKTFPAEVRATKPEGRVIARIATTGTADLVGDVMCAGAMDRTVAQARAVNRRWPVLHEHGRDLTDHLGSANPHNAELRPDGLVIVADFDLDDDRGRRAYQLVQKNVLREWSIGFIPVRTRPRPGGGRDLLEIDLVEISLTLKGVAATQTLEVRSQATTSALTAAQRLAPRRAQVRLAQLRVARWRGLPQQV